MERPLKERGHVSGRAGTLMSDIMGVVLGVADDVGAAAALPTLARLAAGSLRSAVASLRWAR